MIHLFKRAVLIGAVFMFGFILGIVYMNHAETAEGRVGFILPSPQFKDKEADGSAPYLGFKWKDSYELKIDMEDGEAIVIYDEGEMSRHDFIGKADVQRDLLDKQNYVIDTKNNFFSEMGLKTADAFEGIFQKMFAVLE